MAIYPYDLGFLGGGQLARMSIQAAQRMGFKCLSLDPGTDTPAGQVAPCLTGALDDVAKICEMLTACEFVTLENEFIPAQAIRSALANSSREESAILPGVSTLELIQDKLVQRQAYQRASVPSPRAVPVGSDGTVTLEFPMVLKARFGGYDGKGTRFARDAAEFESHRDLWSAGNWLAESFVPFIAELAVMVYVSADGTARGTFPTMETVQKNHVCDLVFPSSVDASQIALDAVASVGGRGVYGVELFLLQDGSLQVNEIAPRPHNTGHYTLDWGGVSQFEQHVRLVMGLPPIHPAGQPACMANLLGQPGAGDYRPGLHAALKGDPEIRVHWYGKAEAKPGRKMGHLNAVGQDCVNRAVEARNRFYAAW